MTTLKLSAIPDDRPVKVTVALRAAVNCDLNGQHVSVAFSIGGDAWRS
ncbi:DUF2274 domain-containing protein [Mesorhizobium sp. WSM3626]|nr:DUF2274 domain-containing protein [Mesorhizobium sp. WSM3626]